MSGSLTVSSWSLLVVERNGKSKAEVMGDTALSAIRMCLQSSSTGNEFGCVVCGICPSCGRYRIKFCVVFGHVVVDIA